MLSTSKKVIIIPAIDPYFSDKTPAWFHEHASRIERARRANAWWQRNTVALESDLALRPAEMLRALADFNYEKVQTLGNHGEFTARGDTVQIYPFQADRVVTVEFLGNRVETLRYSAPPAQRSEQEQRRLMSRRLQARFLTRLVPGDFVVHLDHGVGQFSRHVTERGRRFFEVRYALKDRILVPQAIAEEKLSPYIGFGKPAIHRLGGDLWRQTKVKVSRATEQLARELLDSYARRTLTQRPPLTASEDEFERAFAAAFPFDETPDQADAIADVMADLAKPELMDRVICGDVGFGKTEVAMRAMAKVAFCGKQAALLAPTTVLAQQHFETLRERFEPVGLRVGLLSRAVPDEQIKETLRQLADGSLEIVVATHRLLSEDVKLKNLGLAVIDEEQRFGVKQKEKLKNFRGSVDVLSLTATPIPRTLHLALANVWSVSNIQTPPAGRKAIHTQVAPYDPKLVKIAIAAELARGGAVYYLYNSIRGISRKAEELRKILPKARVEIAHARMDTKRLLAVVDAFRQGAFDVLLATTIIENGLDLPNVNTLIVEKAEKLGLAQAHQIRGRVGRADTQAYAYFLYAPERLSEAAEKRLQYLERFQELGDGLELSLKDLELRGAGDVLGKAQSGVITAVGLNLYSSMLAEAVERIKSEPATHA